MNQAGRIVTGKVEGRRYSQCIRPECSESKIAVYKHLNTGVLAWAYEM